MKNHRIYTPKEIADAFIPRERDGSHIEMKDDLIKAIESYAIDRAKTALNNASNNVKLIRGVESIISGVDLTSITDPSNIQL